MAVAVTRLYLVRHGRAAAGWDTSIDPPLDRRGRIQADDVAGRLAELLAGEAPIDIVSSPLLRCRQTAAPLAQRWNTGVAVETAVQELPSPEGVEMAGRVDWLRQAMRGTWADLGPRYTTFRDQLVAYVLGRTTPAVIFSHFVAINAIIGAAIGDDRLVISSLDNASVTVVDVVDGRPVLIEGGHEADTLIR